MDEHARIQGAGAFFSFGFYDHFKYLRFLV